MLLILKILGPQEVGRSGEAGVALEHLLGDSWGAVGSGRVRRWTGRGMKATGKAKVWPIFSMMSDCEDYSVQLGVTAGAEGVFA